MRVGIELTCWANRRGYGRFARGLVRSLLRADEKNDYVLFVDAQAAAAAELPSATETVVLATRTAPAEAASADGRRSIRDLWTMSAALSRQHLDVLFYPTVYSWFPVRSSATVIVGIHDVIAEDYPQQVFPRPYRRLLWQAKSWGARRQADYLLTVSEHAKRGLLRHFRHPEERVWVVGEAADPVFRPLAEEPVDRALLARLDIDDRRQHLVYLGGFNPHKNVGGLLTALARVRAGGAAGDLRLILIGAVARETFTPGLEPLRRMISELGLESAVRFTGYLVDEEVRQLLAFSRALVLPSLAEGFGLPAVEAAACGTPVVATLNSPLPELLAGGGLFCDPADPEALEAAIGSITTDDPLHAHLAAGALRSARALSWSRSAGQFGELLDLIREARR